MTRRALVSIAVLLLVLAAAGGAGFWFLRGRVDTAGRLDQAMRTNDLRAALLEARNLLRERPDDAASHMKAAEVQLRLDDGTAAEKEASAAITLGGRRGAALVLLGRALAVQGKDKELLVAVPAADPSPETAAELLMLRAAAQLRQNDVAAAAETLAAAQRDAPDRAATFVIAAGVDAARKDAAASEANIDRALQRDPGRFEALMGKQSALAQRQDVAGAMAMVERAVAAQPWSDAARLARGDLLMAQGEDAKAAVEVATVLRNHPRNAFGQYLNAVLLVRARRFTEAQAALGALAEFTAEYPRLDYFRAIVAGQLGMLNPAEEFAARYARRAPEDVPGVLLLAQAELALRRPDAALAALQKVAEPAKGNARYWDMQGLALAAAGRLKEASASFDRAAALAPDNAEFARHAGQYQAATGGPETTKALDHLAEVTAGQTAAASALIAASLRAGEVERAETALSHLRAEVGATEQAGLLGGEVALAVGDYGRAEEAYSDTIRKFPDSMAARFGMARVRIVQGRAAEAGAFLAEILSVDRANPAALNNYLTVQTGLQQFRPAIQAVEAARRAVPGNGSLLLAQAEVMTRSGDAAGAVELLKAASLATPTPALRGGLAEAQLAAGFPADAKAGLDELIRAQPNNPEMVRAKLRLLVRREEYSEAQALLTDAVAKFPQEAGFMADLLGVIARLDGVDAALRRADALRGDAAHMPAATALRGDVFATARRYGDAAAAYLAEYRKAASPRLLTRAAGALIEDNRAEEAAGLLRRRLEEQRDDVDALRQLSAIDQKAGRYAAARQSLEAVLQVQRNDVFALNNLAWVYSAEKDPRALATAQKAFVVGSSPETADTYGWMLLQGGDPVRAVPLLRAALRQRPGDSAVSYHLAAALAQAGGRDEAVALLRAVKAGGAFAERGAAEALLGRLAP